MPGRTIRKQIFLIFFIALFLLVARLFYPFLTIVLWSALIYGFVDPLFERLTTRGNGLPRSAFARSVWAGVLALSGVTILVVPTVFLGISLIRQFGDIARNLLATIEARPELLDLSPSGAIGGFVYRISGGGIDLSSVNLMMEVKHFLSASSGKIIGFSGTLIKNALGMGLTLAFMVFTLYFLLVDGKHLAKVLVGALPIDRIYSTMFLAKLRESGRQLIVGFFLVSLFQAIMMFIVCLLFGIKNTLVLASLTAVASFIPMAGTALVWMPLAAIIAIGGNLAKAIAFALCAALLVSSLDNFIRPLLLGERLKIHPLLIFFSILGGLSLFGFNGLVLGPLILILFFSAAELFDGYDETLQGEAAGAIVEGKKEEESKDQRFNSSR
jgi:predicted PurR-regulated permease PerM